MESKVSFGLEPKDPLGNDTYSLLVNTVIGFIRALIAYLSIYSVYLTVFKKSNYLRNTCRDS